MSQNTTFIKLAATLFMLIDHIGAILFPRNPIFRILGRIAFPLFAYCLVLGFLHTRDLKRYFSRLLLCAAISQPIYIFALGLKGFHLNVLFSFLLGLVALCGIREKNWLLLGLAFAVAIFLPVEYGLWGVVLMVIFYLFQSEPMQCYLFSFIWLFFPAFRSVQAFAVLSLPFLLFDPECDLHIPKYFFYLFYPLHLLVLGLSALLI